MSARPHSAEITYSKLCVLPLLAPAQTSDGRNIAQATKSVKQVCHPSTYCQSLLWHPHLLSWATESSRDSCFCVIAGLLQPDFLRYLEQFTDTPATVGGQEVEGRIRRPFLKRTMISPAAAEEGPPEERELAIMNGTQMRNGLECKLTTSTSKVGARSLFCNGANAVI